MRHHWALLLALGLGIGGGLASAARAEPYLVRDIAEEQTAIGSQPRDFTKVGEVAFFVTRNAFGLYELWRTDGTGDGTRRVFEFADIGCSGPQRLHAAGDHLLFDCDHRLWRSDGTADGTFPVAEARYGFRDVFLPAAGRLLFLTQGEEGPSIWVTDLGRDESSLLFDLHPDIGGSEVLACLDAGRAVFVAETSAEGLGLWVTDGTRAGTRFLRGLEGPIAHIHGDGGGRLFFFATTAAEGTELWTTDGTSAGTHITRDINGGTESTWLARRAFIAGGVYYFGTIRGDSTMDWWRSDGSPAGTLLLRNFASDYRAADPFRWRPLGEHEGAVYWQADDGAHGYEIWRTDGTVAGTHLTADLCPGSCSQAASSITSVGGRIFLWIDDGTHGSELHVLDGEGAHRVTDLCPGECGAIGGDLAGVGGLAVFDAGGDFTNGHAVWVSDGTPDGTRRLTREGLYVSSLTHWTVAGRALFAAQDETGYEPWITDGTVAGTHRLADINGLYGQSSSPQALAAVRDTLFFFADGGDESPDESSTFELWSSDGTESRTRRLTDLRLGWGEFGETRALGDRLFFAVGAPRSQLWVTDGTRAGTRRLATSQDGFDLKQAVAVGDELFVVLDGRVWSTDGTVEGSGFRSSPGVFVRNPHLPNPLAVVGSSVLFAVGEDGDLWRFDSLTRASHLLLHDEDPYYPQVGTFFAGDGLTYFAAADAEHGFELWRSDGTPAGTRLVIDIVPGEEGSYPRVAMPVSGGIVYVEAASSGRLWRSDGTQAGTWPIAESTGSLSDVYAFAEGVLFVEYRYDLGTHTIWYSDGGPAMPLLPSSSTGIHEIDLVAVQGGVAYLALHGSNGTRLWRTDGSRGGTVDLAAGHTTLSHELGGPRLESATIGDRLFFLGPNGRDLWRTDGTAAGTVAVQPFWREAEPLSLTVAGERLFFSAYETTTGRELWAMPVWDLFADETTTLRVGHLARFTVEVEWSDGTRSGRGTVAPLRSADSGLLWFSSERNWEMLVKVLDGCSINDRFWVFSAATTTVEYALVVIDTWTGVERRWENALGHPATPIAETDAFATCGTAASRAPAASVAAATSLAKTACPDGQGLCLGAGGRYRVTLDWTDGVRSGAGTPVAGSRDAGLFWFFSEKNWEMLVKVLDGCAINGRRWVFAAATTTVGYTLRVEDTVTGEVETYPNTLGNVAETVTDTDAFLCD